MPVVNIKPLSSNKHYEGKKVKTAECRKYEKDLSLILPNNVKIPEGWLQVWYVWGVSYFGSDNDNPIKIFQDVLQSKYKFNDNKVVRTVTDKVKVKKGEEYIYFEIRSINDNFNNLINFHGTKIN